MEEQFPFNPIILTSLLSLLIFLCFFSKSKPSTKTKRPPSPYKLPIIGNMHQLSSLPHQALHSLAKTHGPLMLLHFGSVPVLIVSSADLAREITRSHDIIFANRPHFKGFKKLTYNCKDLSLLPYGEQWRKLKSIVVLKLLSNKRVQSFRSIRVDETALFVKKVRESPVAVDLSKMLASFTNDVIGRAAFGRKYSESENGKKFMRAMANLLELLGFINIGDFIPWLDWIGRFNGFDKRLDHTAKEMDDVFESMIEERHGQQVLLGEKNTEEPDFLDIMLEMYDDGTVDASMDRESMKAFLLDVFIGGSDTISTVMEWAMSEMLRNPKTMQKLQNEVKGIMKEREEIRDEDLEKMHYLKAVIKEALRCHPPVPLLMPRVSSEDVQFKGYHISAGTVMMINAWAIGRDPVSWDEPEKFEPERFLNSSIDFKGQDFELIPFGAGRRGCPGISFAIANIEFALANLVHKFDWKLPNGINAEDMDMAESPGITNHRAVPLVAIASHSK